MTPAEAMKRPNGKRVPGQSLPHPPQSSTQKLLVDSAAVAQSTRALIAATRKYMSRSQGDWEDMQKRVQSSRDRIGKNYFLFQDHLVGGKGGSELDRAKTQAEPSVCSILKANKNMADTFVVIQAAYCRACYLAVTWPRCSEDEGLRKALYEVPTLDLVLKRGMFSVRWNWSGDLQCGGNACTISRMNVCLLGGGRTAQGYSPASGLCMCMQHGRIVGTGARLQPGRWFRRAISTGCTHKSDALVK